MNRLATQPISLDQTSKSLQLPHSLPSGASALRGVPAHDAAQPAIRPAVFCPLHYESGYAYPLIVWLHGEGASEHELREVVPRISLRNYVAVGPRGTADAEREGTFTWTQAADVVELADERVCEAIDYVSAKLNVAPQRIFIAGRGPGATMALRLALQRPERFAGAIALDGLLPRSDQPLRSVNQLRELPLLLSIHAQSGAGGSGLCDDLRLLHAAGMSVSLRQYMAAESALPLMLADIDRWMMEVMCPSSEQAASR